MEESHTKLALPLNAYTHPSSEAMSQLKTSNHWDSPPVEESHTKPTLPLNAYTHPSSEAMSQTSLIKTRHPHGDTQNMLNNGRLGEHLGTTLGPKTGIRNPS